MYRVKIWDGQRSVRWWIQADSQSEAIKSANETHKAVYRRSGIEFHTSKQVG